MPSSLDFSGNPLANDDRTLPSPSPLDFSGSPAGLDLSRSPASPLGLQNAPQGIDFGAATAQMQSMMRAPMVRTPPRSTEAPIYFSPSTGEIVVNGFNFNQRNASQALASEQYANQPRANFTLPDTATDWREMPRDEYAAYLDTIKNPSYGRRMGEAWENAWRGMGDIAVGAGLAADRALTGDEDNQWLLGARANLSREFEENAPFMMQLRDVQSPGDALTYFSQMLVQGAPWLVETAVSMGVGGLIGGAASGGVGAPAGAIEAFTAKEALRAASRQLLRNNLARGARAYEEAMARRVATQQATTALTREEVVSLTGANADDVNRFFNFGERAYHMSRTGVGGSGMAQAGQVAGMSASNYMTGVGDIRNSIADAGGDTESADAVANIWGLAVPYAFVESMGDLLLTQPVSHLLPGMLNGPTRIGNALAHAGTIGAAEGVEEGSQYIITQQGVAGATNRPISIEPMDLLENVVGGAIAGAGLGGVTGAMGRPTRRPATSNAGTAAAEPIAGLTPDGPLSGPESQATALSGQDYYDEDHGSMGGLTPPDIDPNYGNAGADTRFEITGRPVTGNRANEEAETLRNTLNDPTLTYDQRQSIQTAIDALSGSNELDREAADRGAAAVGSGQNMGERPLPQYGPAYDAPGLAEEMTSIRQDIENRPQDTYSYPGSLSRNPIEPSEYEDINLGPNAAPDETAMLNHALGQLQERAAAQPTAPTELSNPELAPIDPVAPMGEYNRPDDGLRGRNDDVTVTNLNAPVQDTNPIMPDGLPKYGKHRLKPMVDANGKPTGSEAEPDLIEEARKKGKSLKKNQKRQEQRRKQRAIKTEARKEEVQKRIDKMAEEPTDESEQQARDQRNMRGFNRSDGERQARYETERAANIKATEDTPFEAGTEEELSGNKLKKIAQRKKAKLEASDKVVDTIKEVAEKLGAKAISENELLAMMAEAKRKKEAKPETVEQSAEVNQSRIDKAKTALQYIAAKEGKDAKQKAANAALQLSKGREVKQRWFFANGDALTHAELVALIEQLKAEKAENKEAKPKATSKSKAAELFHSHVEEEWKNSKNPATGSKETFETFVLQNRIAVQDWLDTPLVSGRIAAARRAAQEILELNKPPQRATGDGQGKRDVSTGRPPTITTRILRKTLKDNPDFTFTAIHPATRERALEVLNKINEALALDGEETITLKQAITALKNVKANLSQNEKPKRATGERLPRKVIDVRTPDGPSQIYVNPDRSDVVKLTRTPLGGEKIKHNTARFVIDKNGNVFVGNGYYFIHDQIVDVVEDKGITVAGYITHDMPQDGHGEEAVTGTIYNAGEQVLQISGWHKNNKQVTQEDLWPKANGFGGYDSKRSTGNVNATVHKTVSQTETRNAVNKIQRNISQDVKFKTIHVMSDVLDIFNRGNDEMMIAPNGAEVSLMQYIKRQAALMKLENPEFKNLSEETVMAFYIQTHMQAKAFVVPGYQALFVFADYMKDNRDLREVLEHEYVVHAGLKAIFPDRVQRELFLNRFGKIPGVEEMRKHLLAVKPEYGNVSYLDQLEEVIAYQSMHGPLAVERLLSAEEGIDQATRTTLWQDLKRMVAEWIAKVFGDKENKTGDAMDDIVAALREHAITGRTGDVMSLLDKHGAPPLTQQERDDFYASVEEKVKRAVTDTPAETQALLYGTDTNPGRPYKKQNYASDMYEMVRSNEPLIEKLSAIRDRNVAAPIREGLRKIGRELVTMNQMALQSPLIEKMMRIMHNTIKVARNIMTRTQEERQYAVKSATTARIRALWGDTFPGSTDAQIEAYNRMAIIATNNRMSTLSDSEVRNAPRLLVRNVDGTYTINYAVYDDMLKRGTLSKEEYEAGVEQFTVDKKGETTSAGVAKLTKEQIDLGYDMYVSETKLMAKSALTTLEHTAQAMSLRGDSSIDNLIREIDFKERDQPFVREALQRMHKLYGDIAFHNYSTSSRETRYAQKEMARQVLVELQRAFHEPLKVDDWTDSRATRKEGVNPRKNDAFKWREQVDPHDDVKPFANQIRWFLEYDDTFNANRMQHISDLGVSESQQYQIMNAFQALINNEMQALELENDVIQSVMGNYVEMTRKGSWRVALEARGLDGKSIADVNPELLAVLPTTYVESSREAIKLQQELQEEFMGKEFTVNNAEGKPITITFDVSRAMAPGTKTMGDAPKVREFLKVAELAGMTLKPHQMKVIANLIESAASRKRLGLQRAGTPGADINILQNNSETMTRRAWQAAKTSQAWMLESTMTDRKNQTGDWDKLAQLQQNFDIANRGAPEGSPAPITFQRNKAAVAVAELELLRYANQLRHVAKHSVARPTVNIRTTKGEQKMKIEGQAEAYNVHAQALKASLDQGTIEVNLNDMLSKTGPLRQMAVVSQLGTVAAGIMNAFTPLTHLPWRLTAKHEKTGYGEGFSYTEAFGEIMTATTQVGNIFKNLADSVKIKKLLDDAKAGNNSTNLTVAELEAMYQETLNGVLMPQQTYSLTGGTESSITNLLVRNLMTMFLGPFSSVEAATRRVAFLATYRLIKARYLAAGVSEEKLNDPTSAEYKKLMQDIESVVFDTQGDYSNVNRPRSFRGDWAQYILQYKMFPLNTVLLIKNLPRKEQAVMLGTIFLLAGLKGEPFADDFADIYDTLLQNLGFKHDSVELQLTQTLEDIMPGSSNWIMHGFIDNIAFGGTMSSRLSMGDILPMTGIMRPEADIGRELTNALGPAFAANMDAVEWAGTVADYALQAAGAKPRTTSWVELIRRFPQGQVRALTETGMMAQSGEIVDPRGRLVSDEVTAMNMFSRALGFYPLEASKANTAVRLDRMHTGYMRAVRARFILAYANAYRANDEERMESINDAVRDWNDAVEQTGQGDMEIRNFRTAAVRAGRAASSTTIERTSQGAPDYSVIDEVAGILNADEESE